MRVHACAQFRDDCLSLLVALYSETACKDSTNNWNMQTFFYFFCNYLDFCLFFQVFGGKMSLYGLFFMVFCHLLISLDPLDPLDSLVPKQKQKTSQKGSLSFCCQTRIRRSACACCNDCCFAALGNRTSSLSPQIRNLRGPLQWVRIQQFTKKTKDSQMRIFLFCCQTRIRTQTDRTRICSATVTPFGKADYR